MKNIIAKIFLMFMVVVVANSSHASEKKKDALLYLNGVMTPHPDYSINYNTLALFYENYRVKHNITSDYVLPGLRNRSFGVADFGEMLNQFAELRGKKFNSVYKYVLGYAATTNISASTNASEILSTAEVALFWQEYFSKVDILADATQDLTDILVVVKNLLSENYRVVIIAHSQGGVFANATYNSLTEIEKRSVETVLVGSPIPKINSGFGYVTATNDLVMNGARIISDILPGNSTNQSVYTVVPDFLNHSFSDAYLPGNVTGNFIETLIDVAFRTIESPKDVEDEIKKAEEAAAAAEAAEAAEAAALAAQQCGNYAEENGDIKGLELKFKMGPNSGKAHIEFEAYGIPDSLSILIEGKEKWTSGFISGFRNYEYIHEPDLVGSIYTTFKVVGSEEGTLWNLYVGCPGEKPLSETSHKRKKKRYSTTFVVKADRAGAPACSFNFFVDGILVRKKGSKTVDHTMSVTLTEGDQHYYQYLDVDCDPGLNAPINTNYRAYYSAGINRMQPPISRPVEGAWGWVSILPPTKP